MTEILPTVRIKHPDGYAIINERDFDTSVHEAFDAADPLAGPIPSGAFVAKGPRGLWFVMHGEDRISKGFKTEAEAIAEMSA